MEKLTNDQIKALVDFLTVSKFEWFDNDIERILLYFNDEVDKDNERLKLERS
tara:strand:+ start:141 stop:296 length:156 start_codon:yes stop_codon:yes gene_type:complete